MLRGPGNRSKGGETWYREKRRGPRTEPWGNPHVGELERSQLLPHKHKEFPLFPLVKYENICLFICLSSLFIFPPIRSGTNFTNTKVKKKKPSTQVDAKQIWLPMLLAKLLERTGLILQFANE